MYKMQHNRGPQSGLRSGSGLQLTGSGLQLTVSTFIQALSAQCALLLSAAKDVKH